MNELSIHLGAHGTGHDHLQRTLRRHRAMLTERGVAALLPRDLRRGEIPFHALMQNGLAGSPARREAAQGALAAAAGGAAAHLILSDENIAGSAHARRFRATGLLYPEAHLRLHRLLTGLGLGPATVFLSVRDPASHLVAAYLRRIGRRGYVPFDRFRGTLDCCLLSWGELVERLLTGPLVDHVVVWPAEAYPAISRDLLGVLLGPELAPSLSPPPYKPERLLSAAAFDRIREQAAFAGTLSAADIRTIAAVHPVGPDQPAFQPLPPEEAAESARYYAEELSEIGAMAEVTLIGHGIGGKASNRA